MADGTKPLPEPVLPNHQLGPVTFAVSNSTVNTWDLYPWYMYKFENYSFHISVSSPVIFNLIFVINDWRVYCKIAPGYCHWT